MLHSMDAELPRNTRCKTSPFSQDGTMKRCSSPRHEGANPLPVESFCKDKHAAGGRSAWCRGCKREDAQRRDASHTAGLEQPGARLGI